jgi:hypothetical protein
VLHPDFPTIEGECDISKEWSLTLPARFNRRLEDGDLVIWRPRLTFWIAIWGDEEGSTPASRAVAILESASPERTNEQLRVEGPYAYLTYELLENDQERSPPSYTCVSGYVLTSSDEVQISAYCDTAADRSMAHAVIASMRKVALR